MSQSTVREYLKLADSKAVNVLIWLLDNRNSKKEVNTTLDTIAKECDVTKVTVNRIFQKLYKEEFLVKVRNGQYKMKKV